MIQRARARALGPVLPQHAKLFRRQRFAPFFFRLGDHACTVACESSRDEQARPTMKRLTRIVSVAIALATAATFLQAARPHAASTSPVQSKTASALDATFDSYVLRVLKTFEVPGAALAIVKDGD